MVFVVDPVQPQDVQQWAGYGIQQNLAAYEALNRYLAARRQEAANRYMGWLQYLQSLTAQEPHIYTMPEQTQRAHQERIRQTLELLRQAPLGMPSIAPIPAILPGSLPQQQKDTEQNKNQKTKTNTDTGYYPINSSYTPT